MTTTAAPAEDRPRLLSAAYAATTIGMFSLCALVAFEATAVTTVMPTVAKDLGNVGLYAMAFAAPLASGVVGMVAAGAWSDRRGPVLPLVAALVLFALGLVVCGLAPSMEVLVAGRIVQGLGGGALTVGLYVVVGLVFPPALQPGVFAAFAAAWVLPTLFGPALAAWIAHALGWEWVFLGAVILAFGAASLLAPALRRLSAPASDSSGTPSSATRLAWAAVAAAAVLALDLLGSREGAVALLAVVAGVLILVSLRRLLPTGTLLARRGLPAVIATRGLISAAFFCGEAYIVFVLMDHWGLSAGTAGLALTAVGIVWALASQVQSRLGERVSDAAALCWGSGLVLGGLVALTLFVWAGLPWGLAMLAYIVAGAGMGFGYPRTGVATLAASTDANRGFNSSALSVAEALGAALALSLSGVTFEAAGRAGLDPFAAVFVLASVVSVAALVAASRIRTP